MELIINENKIDIDGIREETASKSPLIHCITNPISINDCANTVLLTGAKPIMAEHPDEAAEITGIADALAVNLGNITDARLKSIRIAADTAAKRNIPSIIDMVGITCSSLRLSYAKRYIDDFTPSIIKGNLAEIKALCDRQFCSIGIDAVSGYNISKEDCELVMSLAASRGCVVMATGQTDLISDGTRVFLIKNGTRKLALITGTGCMLNVLTASFLPAAASVPRTPVDAAASASRTPADADAPVSRTPVDAAVTASLMLGICGEIADHRTELMGLGSFHIALLDELSRVTTRDLCESADVICSTARSI